MSIEQAIDIMRDVYMTRQQREAYERIVAERNQLLAFANDILDSWPDGGSLDGGDIQEYAVKHALLIPYAVMEPCNGGDPDQPCRCAEYCTPDEFAEGVICYQRADTLKGGVAVSADTQQVIYALRRVQAGQQALADKLHDAHDYNAELPAADAERLGEAIELVRQRDQLLAALECARRAVAYASQHDKVFEAEYESLNNAIAAAKGGAA